MKAGGRSSKSAALVQAAGLGLELKCSAAVWLLSVPWLMSCGTGWYLASCWHPHSDRSTVSKFFFSWLKHHLPRSAVATNSCLPNMWTAPSCRFNFLSDRHRPQGFSHLTSDTGSGMAVLFPLFFFFFIQARRTKIRSFKDTIDSETPPADLFSHKLYKL